MSMIPNTGTEFDFDAWAALARADQDAFEKRRQEHIRVSIDKAVQRGGDKRKLQGMQCRLDMERLRARTPMKACIRYYSLMWDSVVELREALDDCILHRRKNMDAIAPFNRLAQKETARIVSFPGAPMR